MQLPVYIDNHATTPVDPRVLETMLPYFCDKFGNAASRHAFGWEAEAAVEEAREQVARLIHAASPKEIVFTSGATESDNLAIKGVADAYRDKGNHIITCATEHKAVLDCCKTLERQGLSITYLPVDAHGLVSPDQVREAVTERTILISLMAANNETGTLHPVTEIGRIAKEKGIIFHSDATQAVGKIPVDVEEMGMDFLSMTAHKMYGPKGVGALYVRSKRPKVRLRPIMDGGGHEWGLRAGTLNVSGIVGFGKACQIAGAEMQEEAKRLIGLRERLREGIFRHLDEVYLNGHPTLRLPGNLNLSFAFVEGESLLMGLKEIAVSSGSACTSAALETSHVLRAMGVAEDLAHAAIRFGLGRYNTAEEVDFVARRVVEEVQRLRSLSPLYVARARSQVRPEGEWKVPGGPS